MKTRVVSSLIMVPLLGLVLIGGRPLFAGVMAISVVAMHEFYKGFENLNIHPNRAGGYICAAILFSVMYVYLFTGANTEKLSEGLLLWVYITVICGLGMSLFMRKYDIMDGLVTIIGVMYLPFFYTHVSLIGSLERNAGMIWLVFITAFGTDISAYFAGMRFGKHKLCPNISPKKTVEGSLGGVMGSTVLSWIFGALMFPQHAAGCVVMGMLGSVCAQCGDLIASSFKRKMQIKDYGDIIPGHGGVLDRFDSVVLTAPFVYYYIVLLINR